MSFYDVESGRTSLTEAYWLVKALLAETQSWYFVRNTEGWTRPASREELVGLDNFDLHSTINTKKGDKPELQPRPYRKHVEGKIGHTMTLEKAKKLLKLRTVSNPDGVEK